MHKCSSILTPSVGHLSLLYSPILAKCSDEKFTISPWDPFDYLPPLKLTLFSRYIASCNLTFIFFLDLNHTNELTAFLHDGFSTSYSIPPPRFFPSSIFSAFMVTILIKFSSKLNSLDSFHDISSNLSVWHWLNRILWMV